MADESRGQGPDAAPGADKEEIATDLSEVARQRLSGTDKTDTGGSIEADAKDLAEGVAGKPADDDTAAAVETSPTAAVTESHPGPKAGTEQGPDRPTPTAPAPPAQEGSRTTPETTTAGGSGTAPAERAPAGTGAPTRPAQAEATTPTPEPASAPSGGATPQGGAPAAEAETGGTPARPPGAVRPAAGARPPGGPGGRPAAPAAPPKPPEPEPEELPAFKEIVPDLAWERRHGYVELKIPSDKLVAMAERVKALGYDYLSAVTAVDWRDRVEMLYHLYAYDYVAKPGCIVLRADLPPEPNPLCPSLTPIWPGAEFQEREVYDLFGVKFVGHPDLRRILTEDRFPGHPLRKDWTFDYQYVLVKHLRYGVEQQHEPPGGQEGYRSV